MMRSRISAASVVAVAVLAGGALFHGPPVADATQGQPVIAGQANDETKETVLNNTSETGSGCAVENKNGLVGCGRTGLDGWGTVFGVNGRGPTGVRGFGGTGIYGEGTE